VHGNLDGREMKQAVTQRTSQLPLLLVAGNSMAEDFFALASEASVKPVPVSLPARPFRLTRPLQQPRTTMARARRSPSSQGRRASGQCKLKLPSFWGPIGVYSAALAASPLVATAAPNLASDDGASSRRYDSCS
jgi:hypothetical protein